MCHETRNFHDFQIYPASTSESGNKHPWKSQKNPELLQAWADSLDFLLFSFIERKESKTAISLLKQTSSVLNIDISSSKEVASL